MNCVNIVLPSPKILAWLKRGRFPYACSGSVRCVRVHFFTVRCYSVSMFYCIARSLLIQYTRKTSIDNIFKV